MTPRAWRDIPAERRRQARILRARRVEVGVRRVERDAVVAVIDEPEADGWRCSRCSWSTTELAEINQALWVTAGGALDMVCPECGAVGQFVDLLRDDDVALGQDGAR